ncbi:unnamed protein product [Lota lota]
MWRSPVFAAPEREGQWRLAPRNSSSTRIREWVPVPARTLPRLLRERTSDLRLPAARQDDRDPLDGATSSPLARSRAIKVSQREGHVPSGAFTHSAPIEHRSPAPRKEKRIPSKKRAKKQRKPSDQGTPVNAQENKDPQAGNPEQRINCATNRGWSRRSRDTYEPVERAPNRIEININKIGVKENRPDSQQDKYLITPNPIEFVPTRMRFNNVKWC